MVMTPYLVKPAHDPGISGTGGDWTTFNVNNSYVLIYRTDSTFLCGRLDLWHAKPWWILFNLSQAILFNLSQAILFNLSQAILFNLSQAILFNLSQAILFNMGQVILFNLKQH